MPDGFGKGRGFFRGGIGFGFRGSSPPWPYIGRGRGGLPRCWSNIGTPFTYHPMSLEQELSLLRGQAEALHRWTEEIERRIKDLETKG